jgi:hypothetical protein
VLDAGILGEVAIDEVFALGIRVWALDIEPCDFLTITTDPDDCVSDQTLAARYQDDRLLRPQCHALPSAPGLSDNVRKP